MGRRSTILRSLNVERTHPERFLVRVFVISGGFIGFRVQHIDIIDTASSGALRQPEVDANSDAQIVNGK